MFTKIRRKGKLTIISPSPDTEIVMGFDGDEDVATYEATAAPKVISELGETATAAEVWCEGLSNADIKKGIEDRARQITHLELMMIAGWDEINRRAREGRLDV